MRKVVIDSKSHQAIRHAGTEATHYPNPRRIGGWKGVRLTGLQADLHARGFDLLLGELCDDTLKDIAVLIIAGRRDPVPFTECELAALKTDYRNGGGLLLMANQTELVAPQNQVATALCLPVYFHEEVIATLQPRLNKKSSHQTLIGCDKGLQFRTSCTMTLESGSFVPLVIDENSEIGVLAAAMENTESNVGRVVVTTSAGHIASLDDSRSDLYATASNAIWTLNIVEWLSVCGND